MGKSQETFGKKEREKKREKKRQEKLLKKAARKEDNNKGKTFEEMIVYKDEFGQLSDTPPDPKAKKVEIDASSIVLGVPKKEDMEETKVKKGKVDFFNDEKGFGFILEKGTNMKYFVHVHGCLQEINQGDNVMFELERGPKGMQCCNVKKL